MSIPNTFTKPKNLNPWMIFRSHHQTLTTFLLKIWEREWVIKKILGWHGGEPHGESGDVLRHSGECPKWNPQGRGLFLRESKRNRGGGCLGRVWEKGKWLLDLSACELIPPARGTREQSTTHPRTVHEAPANSPWGMRTVRHPGADGPFFNPEPPVPPRAPSTRADGLHRTGNGLPCTAGQSGPLSRTVWLVFFFSAWCILK
jgi:hypothetical protein